MVNTESFPDLASADMDANSYFYVRASAAAAGSRDKRFAFSSLMRTLFASANEPAARIALGIITATAVLDFASIATTASEDKTITVNGAVVGDAVFIGLPAAPAAGLVFFGFVSAADTVTIRAMNITGSGVNPASATYRAVVIKSA